MKKIISSRGFMKSITTEFLKDVYEAQIEAIKRGIETNMLVISEKLGAVPECKVQIGDSSVAVIRPMILGLEVKECHNLPDGVIFALTHEDKTDYEKMVESIIKNIIGKFAINVINALEEACTYDGHRFALDNNLISGLVVKENVKFVEDIAVREIK